MRLVLLLPLVVVAASLDACVPSRWVYAPDERIAREVAARQFDCSDAAVTARMLGTRQIYDVELQSCFEGPVYLVRGCGHEAVYECRLDRGKHQRQHTERAPICWVEGTWVAQASPSCPQAPTALRGTDALRE